MQVSGRRRRQYYCDEGEVRETCIKLPLNTKRQTAHLVALALRNLSRWFILEFVYSSKVFSEVKGYPRSVAIRRVEYPAPSGIDVSGLPVGAFLRSKHRFMINSG